MSKITAPVVGVAFLILAVGRAWAAFPPHPLKGPYVLHLRGFQANETAPPFHTGEFGALGLVNFDGRGGVSGSIHFTGADSGGDQAGCGGTIDSMTSSDTVNAEGRGSLTLGFTASSRCVVAGTPTPTKGGSLTFVLVVNDKDVKSASLLLKETPIPPGLTIAGERIDALVLDGELISQAL